jgi:hypothetical protein
MTLEGAIRVCIEVKARPQLSQVEFLCGKKSNQFLAAARGYQLHSLYHQYGSSSILNLAFDAIDRAILVEGVPESTTRLRLHF